MNMSEFDGQMNMEEGRSSSSHDSIKNRKLPDDFSEEDVAFARELDSLFNFQEEELPPYFAQTLLNAEESRFQPVERGFELKTRARVFRRLKLRRRLFKKERPTLSSVMTSLPLRRPLMAFSMALMMFMLLTIVITGPSFASGMQVLLRGGKTGVLTVLEYPHGVASPPAIHNKKSGVADIHDPDFSQDAEQKQISLLAAQQQMHFNMYWPQAVPDVYTLSDIYLYQEPQQQWTDGPFIEFNYSLPSNQAQGTGMLTVREFKLDPSISVLQVVKAGSEQAINIDQSGQGNAIYVDGQWELHNKVDPVWVFGQRSELIYQRDGIVFWIVGDQRDGMNESALMNIALSLQPVNVARIVHNGMATHLAYVTPVGSDVEGPFTGDVLAVFSSDSTVGPYLSVVGASSTSPAPKKPAQTTPNLTHYLKLAPRQ